MNNRYVKFILGPLAAFSLLAVLDIIHDPNPKKIIYSALGWFLIGCLGMEIGIHRLISHRSFTCSRTVQNILSFLGCLGAQWSPLQWAALHVGIHHRLSDQTGDIHSPQRGAWNSYLGWYFSVKASDINIRRVRYILDDEFQVLLHRHYLTIYWGTVALISLINPDLGLYGIVIPSILTIQQTNSTNFICHLRGVGYRNYFTLDNSSNVRWWSIFSFGLSLHNNHHAFPSNWNFSHKKLEIDPSGIVLRLLNFLRIIKLSNCRNLQSIQNRVAS